MTADDAASGGRTHATDDYFDLGSYSRPCTTDSAAAKIWFDRGLVWTYAFNHEEAAECFDAAIAADENFALAYWGLAYALGPNYNKPWEFFDPTDLETTVDRTHRAVEQAGALVDAVAPVERALIEALAHRYPQATAADDCSIWNQGYADAMRDVYRRFPDDLDVATLFSDALMNLTPWELWDLQTELPADGSSTYEAKEVLDRALERDDAKAHPGLLHMYIHLMEMSGTPERALSVADHLRGLVPDAGHLHHMPTHLDILCGDYRRAMASNQDAIVADEKYLARGDAMNFYTLYRSHNYHFRIYAAMFAGQSRVALETVHALENSIPEELLRVQSPPMADWLEGFVAMRVHALIRFGRWKDILELELPKDVTLYCVTTAMTRYARGVALAALGRVDEAVAEQAEFELATVRVPESRTLFNNTCVDILGVAREMLAGELEYRKGNVGEAFEHLRRSIHIDDSLPYDEPWGWMQPTRHAYGALLLEQGRVKEAAAVYAEDLGLDGGLPRALQHRDNVWALHGLHECLVKLGRTAEAAMLRPQLELAVAVADVPIEASCFCRLSAVGQSGDSALPTHDDGHSAAEPSTCCAED